MAVRKAERLVNLIAYLLEANEPATSQKIRDTIPGYSRESWEAFQRMFERDKEELREMGIPLELGPTDVWETEEGYRIPKDKYYLGDVGLTEDEVAALWVAAGLLRLPDPGAARIALLKLGADIPADRSRSQLGWLAADLGMSVAGLSRAFRAVTERKRVTFRYPREGASRARTLAPYGLVHRRGIWYLVGLEEQSGEVRTFRLDRVAGEIRLVDPSHVEPEFEVPEGYRPSSALEAPPFLKGEPVVRARVRFDASLAWRVERESPWLSLEWRDDGAAEAEMDVVEPSGFISWVLWFGEAAEVVSPPELRRTVRARLEEICGGDD